MKRYTYKFTAFLLMAAASASCKKSHVQPRQPAVDMTIHTDKGLLTQDFSMCQICGGYFVKFDDDTSTRYHSLQTLDKFGITSNTKFPLEATISWQQDTTIHAPQYITINSLKIDQ